MNIFINTACRNFLLHVKIVNSLNSHAIQGWRLKAATTNGLNTIGEQDITILIYERKIKKMHQINRK